METTILALYRSKYIQAYAAHTCIMYRDEHHIDDTLVAWGTESAQDEFRNRRARAGHKPVIAIFADHLLVPSKTDCSTDIMWPECAFSSTPKTDLNSDETLFHISCANGRDLVLSASLIYMKYIFVPRLSFREIALSPFEFSMEDYFVREILSICIQNGIQKTKGKKKKIATRRCKRNFNRRANLANSFAIQWKLRSLLQLEFRETEHVAELLSTNLYVTAWEFSLWDQLFIQIALFLAKFFQYPE